MNGSEWVKHAIANLEPGDMLPLWTSLIVLRNNLYELPRLPVLLSIAIRRCWIDLLERDTIHARNHALMIQSGALTRG